MKIALIGYGKMGKLVEQVASDQGHQVVTVFSRQAGLPPSRLSELSQADIAIDFSESSGVIDNLSACLSLKIPLVIGTTGWDGQRETAEKLVKNGQGRCLYSPNFSIGIYLYRQILQYAAALFQAYPAYDVCGFESHHRQKLDSPSGTAKTLTDDLKRHMPRLQKFHFSSIRCGHIPGTHTVQFDCAVDTLTFQHEARNRHGFAQGALLAAEWLLDQKQGFFSFEEMMNNPGLKAWDCNL